MSLRLLAVISAFTLITLTVHPDDILQALLKLKNPLQVSAADRPLHPLCPTLIEDANRISDLQRSRDWRPSGALDQADQEPGSSNGASSD